VDPELPGFVRSLRERADPKALDIDLGGALRKRGLGLRQPEMARLMGISLSWYRRLESGNATWSERWVASFAQVLKLPTAERLVLYRRALGWQREAVLAMSGVAEANKTAVDTIRVPALLLDHGFKVRWRNIPAAQLLPELRPGDNWVLWILASPVARERLLDWESGWAMPTLALLRTAHALAQEHLRAELDVLVDVVRLGSPVAGAWAEDLAYYLSPTGERRRLLTPDAAGEPAREVTVRLWSAQPELSPGWRIYTLEPVDSARARRWAGKL